MTTQTIWWCPNRRVAVFTVAALWFSTLPLALGQENSSLRNTRTVQAIRNAEPAVVNIEGNKPASSVTGSRIDSQQVNGMGAGVIVDSRGYILTNQHVIQDVGRIEVTLHDGRQYVGRLIARHPETDLAMIRIDAGRSLPVIDCGISSDLMRGEPVIAIGNPFGYHNTVTVGIISALHRDIPVNGVEDYPDLIQTDASINPGNSGGPLLNAEGRMIGINAAVRIGAQGIGFAIPVDKALDVAAEMIRSYRRGIGSADVELRTVHRGGKSSIQVVRSTNAELKPGDVIRAVAGRPVLNRLQYELALVGRSSGSVVEYEVERNEGVQVASVRLGGQSSGRVRLASTSSLKQRVESLLGTTLDSAKAESVRQVDSSYKGGLVIRSIRKNSPADKAQLRNGDILVGLMDWQTPNWEDLEWIMKSPEMKRASSPKFHIIRGDEVFWGTFELKAGVR